MIPDIDIKILNDETSENYESAVYIEKAFHNAFPNATGKILIYPDLQVLGQHIKDIDIVVLGSELLVSLILNNTKFVFKYKFNILTCY